MSLGIYLLIFLTLAVLAALPIWSHSSHWSYKPSSGLGLVTLGVLVLVLMGRI